METVENVTFSDATVDLDGLLFVDCKFDHCVLRYAGGQFGFHNYAFRECTLQLSGPARNTANLLLSFEIADERKLYGPLNSGPVIH